MISINKAEAKAIRENLPDVHIVRTMKQKSKRGHYFCEESKRTLKFLEMLKNKKDTIKKAGVENKPYKSI